MTQTKLKLSHFKKTILSISMMSVITFALTACNNSDDSDNTPKKSFKPVSLKIAHINDHHSHLEPEGKQKFTLDGNKYRAERGGFARIKQLYDIMQTKYARENYLKLHAGDALTGTKYYSFYKGDADVALMNTVCFDAFSLGNHEFDDGDAQLKTFLDKLHAGSCKTPVLGANVVPKVGTPLAPNTENDYIKPYIIKETKEGVKVGIIGLDIASKTTKSSRPLETTKFLDEAETAQKYINELQKQGIEHVILLTHYTYKGDMALAKKLTGVDVIIGGDSHTLLGDFSAYGSKMGAGSYPTELTNKNGEKVCIGQAWEYTKAFGLMDVKFNDKGAIESCRGSAIIPISKQLQKLQPEKDAKGKDVYKNLAEADNQVILNKLMAKVDANNGLLASDLLIPVDENQIAKDNLSTYEDKLSDNLAKTIGQSTEDLCLIRIPGDTSRSDNKGIDGCANSATLARGSDIAQIVATSFLNASKRADFALQNAGGVRQPIKKGAITNNDAINLLPFSNTLVNFDITGEQIKLALEDAISNHMDGDGSSGSHPYAAGLRWDLDMRKPKGNRVSNLEVKDKKTGLWQSLDSKKTYVMVTNDYIGGGKDGYTTLGAISKDASKVEDTKLLYTQSFIDYVKKVNSIARPNRADYAHKSVITKAGTRLSVE